MQGILAHPVATLADFGLAERRIFGRHTDIDKRPMKRRVQ